MMPLYKSLPREKKKLERLPFYRPIDRLLLEIWNFRKTLALFLVILVILGVGYEGFRLYESHTESQANHLYEKGEWKGVVQQYPRSRSAFVSRLKLGGQALKEGHYDEAIQWYKPAAESSIHPSIFRIAALQNLALAYVEKGDPEQALQTLQQSIVDRENVTPDYSRFLLARVYEIKGEADKATEIYKSLSEGSQGFLIQKEAKERLAWLEKQEKK